MLSKNYMKHFIKPKNVINLEKRWKQKQVTSLNILSNIN